EQPIRLAQLASATNLVTGQAGELGALEMDLGQVDHCAGIGDDLLRSGENPLDLAGGSCVAAWRESSTRMAARLHCYGYLLVITLRRPLDRDRVEAGDRVSPAGVGWASPQLQHDRLPVARALHVGVGQTPQHFRAHMSNNDSPAVEAVAILAERLV